MKIFVTGGSGFIGTNFIESALRDGHTVLNYSQHPPLNPEHHALWRQGDILDGEAMRHAFADFAPDWVVHFAARTDCDENTTVESGYTANTDGTANLLACIKGQPGIKRAIITSSQFVCGPGRLPETDEDYFPHTVYGQSKVITEQLTRSADLPCCWTLIRPTNIWGPWHERYRREFWSIAARRLYFHPGGKPVVRCYGYVGNVVHQIRRLLEMPVEAVNGRTVYVGDPPTDVYLWANGFCEALGSYTAPKIPRLLLRAMATIGDVISAITRRRFPIDSTRYRSMTETYVTPMEKTFELLGPSPIPLDEGIRATVKWLREQEPPAASHVQSSSR